MYVCLCIHVEAAISTHWKSYHFSIANPITFLPMESLTDHIYLYLFHAFTKLN